MRSESQDENVNMPNVEAFFKANRKVGTSWKHVFPVLKKVYKSHITSAMKGYGFYSLYTY